MNRSRRSVRARRVDAAGRFKPAPLAAPVATAFLTAPLGHPFPLLAVGAHGAALVDRTLERWSYGSVHNGNNVRRSALRARGRFFGGRCFSGGFLSRQEILQFPGTKVRLTTATVAAAKVPLCKRGIEEDLLSW